jgi:hypothetical protein
MQAIRTALAGLVLTISPALGQTGWVCSEQTAPGRTFLYKYRVSGNVLEWDNDPSYLAFKDLKIPEISKFKYSIILNNDTSMIAVGDVDDVAQSEIVIIDKHTGALRHITSTIGGMPQKLSDGNCVTY